MAEPRHEQSREVVQGLGLHLCQPIFEVAPQPLDRIQLRRIGRKEEQRHIRGQAECPGFMERAIVEQQQVEAGGISGRKMVEEEVKALRIQGGQFQKETLAGHGCHGPIQIQALKAIGRRYDRLDSARGDPMAHDRQ